MKKKPQGKCNICGEHQILTLDHVPPKGVIQATNKQVRLDPIHQRVGEKDAREKRTRPVQMSQNGIKFPTICARCNNSLLGRRYDPALIEFTNRLTEILQQPALAVIPDTINIPGQPHKIMRSVLGHLCAIGEDRYKKGTHTEAIRDYMLDEKLDLPEPLRFYYWVYPGEEQVLIRDFVHMQLSHKDPVFTWLMKFRPLAFMITWDEKSSDQRYLVNEMTPWRGYGDIETVVPIPVFVTQKIHPFWPEYPDEHGFSLYGSGAYVATQYGNSDKTNKSNVA